jgi:hypothetical protein
MKPPIVVALTNPSPQSTRRTMHEEAVIDNLMADLDSRVPVG